jgi:aryl-alcohol dehydrogenase-like predicted oxidoreductase
LATELDIKVKARRVRRRKSLDLGGGGLGQVWGESSEEEAIATVHAALAAGFNMIDTAPMYGACETVVASAFQGVLPAGVRITTKCQLGMPSVGTVATKFEESLHASLEAMRLDHVDLYFLHSNVCEDDTVYAHGNDQGASFATPWSQYVNEVVPGFEDLKRRGRIGAWGITGVGVPSTVIKALRHDVKPSVVQAVTNLLDSPGGIRRYSEAPRPRAIIAAAKAHDVGVIGIRAAQAGALTAQFDRVVKASHPDAVDYRTAAPFRAMCIELGMDRRCLRTDTPWIWRTSTPSSSGSRTRLNSHNVWRPRRSGACHPTCAQGSTG